MPQVLGVPGFRIWRGCIFKGYTKFWICLDMAHLPQQYLNMTEYALISLNIPEND